MDGTREKPTEGAKLTPIRHFLLKVEETKKIKLKNGLELFVPFDVPVNWIAKVIQTPECDINVSPEYVASRLGEQIRLLPTVRAAIHNLRMGKLKKWLLSGRKHLGLFAEKDFLHVKIKKRVTLRMDNSMSEIEVGDNVYLRTATSEHGQMTKSYSELIAGERDGELYTIGDSVIITLTEDSAKMPNGLYLPIEMQKNPHVAVVVAAPKWAKCKEGDFVRIKSMPSMLSMGFTKPYYHTNYQNILLISKTKEGAGESTRFFDKKNHYEQYAN